MGAIVGIAGLVVAILCVIAAGGLAILALVAASRGGVIGFFVTAIILLCGVGGILLFIGIGCL
jgi:hypothetical protein